MKVSYLLFVLFSLGLGSSCGILPKQSGQSPSPSSTPISPELEQKSPPTPPQVFSTKRPEDPESYIYCGNPSLGSGCVITRPEVAPSGGSDFDYKVTYTSSCFIGGKSYRSELEVVGSYGGYTLYYGKTETFTLRSSNGLKLVDRDPGVTQSNFFDYLPLCTLKMTVVSTKVGSENPTPK